MSANADGQVVSVMDAGGALVSLDFSRISARRSIEHLFAWRPVAASEVVLSPSARSGLQCLLGVDLGVASPGTLSDAHGIVAELADAGAIGEQGAPILVERLTSRKYGLIDMMASRGILQQSMTEFLEPQVLLRRESVVWELEYA
eukprot:7596714-Pyramimonas_sp.AAC.1